VKLCDGYVGHLATLGTVTRRLFHSNNFADQRPWLRYVHYCVPFWLLLLLLLFLLFSTIYLLEKHCKMRYYAPPPYT